MSVIEKATVEQIAEALNQTKYGALGKWAWQGFVERGSRIAFDYLLDKILDKANDSFRCEPPDRHEAAMTMIAMAQITRKPDAVRAARQYTLCDNLDDRWPEAMVELACLTESPKDVVEIRGFVESKKINGYYLVKALLLIASQDGVEGDSFVDSVTEEAKKIGEPLLYARALAEIYKFSKHRGAAEDLLADAVRKATKDAYLYSRAHTLGIYCYSAGWAIEGARNVAGWRNPRQAESFMAIASILKEFEDLERAYDGAEKIAEGKPNKIWRSLIRIYAGID